MHKFIITAAAILSLAACTSTQVGAGVGAGAGAVVGAATTGNVVGTAVGAGIGAVAGAAAGNVLGRLESDPDRCVYQEADGDRYIAPCPKG